jgi:hypothetical protein
LIDSGNKFVFEDFKEVQGWLSGILQNETLGCAFRKLGFPEIMALLWKRFKAGAISIFGQGLIHQKRLELAIWPSMRK